MGVNSLPKTASRLRFEPGPYCARVQHANHSAADPRFDKKLCYRRQTRGTRYASRGLMHKCRNKLHHKSTTKRTVELDGYS